MPSKRNKKRLKIAVAGLLATVGIGIAGLVYALPSSAAAACPGCYGLEEAAAGIYVQKDIGEHERTAIIQTVESSRTLLNGFWGPLQASPRVLVCSDEACFRRLGGGKRRGMSLYDRVAVLSPRGTNVTIAAHELSMNELHHRIGLWAFATGAVPIWFNEGIAMLSSDDLRYLAPADQANRCLVDVSAASLPSGMFEWNRTALTDRQLYAKAACRTSQWMTTHGGPSAVVALIDSIGAGVSFDKAAR
ncbi:hypothetical protein [Pandoraea pnomenusa]|uniref:hypothetical protein n=1 Tax=Pandoraea pnomenusa TaxID=93220 RepID=UPI003341BE0D